MLDEATVAEFRTALRGKLIQPGDPGYDEACKVYNGMIDKCPDMIARLGSSCIKNPAVNVAA
jgi:hypothetical protein